MAGDGAEPDETKALREHVAKLESDLRETQTILGQCVLTTVAASFVVQTLGREHTALFGSGALSPNGLTPLTQLDKQLQILISSFEETARGG